MKKLNFNDSFLICEFTDYPNGVTQLLVKLIKTEIYDLVQHPIFMRKRGWALNDRVFFHLTTTPCRFVIWKSIRHYWKPIMCKACSDYLSNECNFYPKFHPLLPWYILIILKIKCKKIKAKKYTSRKTKSITAHAYKVSKIQDIHYSLSHVRKSVLAICEQQRHRSACASAQSDQRLYCSLLR